MNRKLLFLLGIVLMVYIAMPVFADKDLYETQDEDAILVEPEQEEDVSVRVSHLPLNFRGLPGLLQTTSTRTVDFLHVAVGLAGEYHFNEEPGFDVYTGAFNAAFGCYKGLEVAVHVPYVWQEYDEKVELHQAVTNTTDKSIESFGDVNFWLRYAIQHHIHYLPSVTVGVAYIASTSDFPDVVGGVHSHGLRIQLSAGLELIDMRVTEYAFAAFFNGEVVLRDIFDNDYVEKSGKMDLGFLFPVDKRNMFNFLLEYNGAYEQGWLNDLNSHSIVGGVRFVMKYFGITAGYGYVIQESDDFDNSQKFLVTVGGRI